MPNAVLDGGTLTFSEEDLTASGILIPYNVKARSNLGEFTVDTGAFTLPDDATGSVLNVEHKRENVVGGVSRYWEQDEGLFASFKFANTPEGRTAFADAKSGKRKHLSAEVAAVKIAGGRATAGRVFGAALVTHPAFEGATLLAAEDTPPDELALGATDDSVTYTAGQVRAVLDHALAALSDLESELGIDPEEDDPTIQRGEDSSDAPAEPPVALAEETNTEPKELIMTASAVAETPVVAGAQVPATLLASAPATPARAEELDLGLVFASIANVKNGMGSTEDAETLLATLTDIKYEAVGGLTTAGFLPPAWVGKLWQGKRYQRKYIDLCTHLFGGIQLGGRTGFTMTPGAELVAEWAGNKVELPSGGATTAKKSSSLKKYGWAADIAREWFDLEGGADVIESLLQLVADSYARVTDQRALTDIFTAASKTTTALDRLVAPGTFPAQAGIGTYPKAMGMLIQAIEAISDADDEPSFAIVNPFAWNQLIYTPKDLIPEFVSFSVKAGSGEANADGKVVVKKAPNSFFAGLGTGKEQVIAGAKGAIEFRELGETPIQLDALDIAKGGVDKAVIGYLETFVVRPESLVIIGAA